MRWLAGMAAVESELAPHRCAVVVIDDRVDFTCLAKSSAVTRVGEMMPCLCVRVDPESFLPFSYQFQNRGPFQSITISTLTTNKHFFLLFSTCSFLI